MSPLKYGTGIGLGLGNADNTLYSAASPLRLQPIHDPVREVDENLKEQ